MIDTPPSDYIDAQVEDAILTSLARRVVALEAQNAALQEANSRLYLRAQTVEALLGNRPDRINRAQVEEIASAADYYADGRRSMDTKIAIQLRLGELVAVRDFVGGAAK